MSDKSASPDATPATMNMALSRMTPAIAHAIAKMTTTTMIIIAARIR